MNSKPLTPREYVVSVSNRPNAYQNLQHASNSYLDYLTQFYETELTIADIEKNLTTIEQDAMSRAEQSLYEMKG